MKNILTTVGFKFACKVDTLKQKGEKFNLTALNEYSCQKGVFVFTECNEIIYVGRTDDLKKRISQCIRDKKDTGSIASTSKLTEDEYKRILKANVYIMCITEDFKENIECYNVFKNM